MSLPLGTPIPIPGMPPVRPVILPPFPIPPMGMMPREAGVLPVPVMNPLSMTMPPPMINPVAMTTRFPLVGLVPVATTAPMIGPSQMTAAIPPRMPPEQKLIDNETHNTPVKKEDNSESRERSRGPSVTVFIGNITRSVPDIAILQILQECGPVLNWNRVLGANHTPEAFGFCEYEDPESALRCIRLLHNYEIGDKKLLAKLDAKGKEKLLEFKASESAKKEKTDVKSAGSDSEKTPKGEASHNGIDEPINQTTDDTIKASIEALLKKHGIKLSKPVESNDVCSPPASPSIHLKGSCKPDENEESPTPKSDYEGTKKSEMGVESDKNSVHPTELSKLRGGYESEEKGASKGKDKSRSREREYDSPKPRSHKRKGDRERVSDNKERQNDLDHDKERDTEKKSSNEIREKELRKWRSSERNLRSSRSPLDTRESERESERPRSGSRNRSRTPKKEFSSSRTAKYFENEDAYEWCRIGIARSKRDDGKCIDEDRENDSRRRCHSRNRGRSPSRSPLNFREREREKSRERQISRNRKQTPSRERSRGRTTNERERYRQEEEESYERRKEGRKSREKSKLYEGHLCIWETREQRKMKEREREAARMEDESRVETVEKVRLKTFLQDYDDQRDDSKYYKGDILMKRMKRRENEIEEDNRDRQREKEEVEELRKIVTEMEHSEPEIQKLEEETCISEIPVSEHLSSNQGETVTKLASLQQAEGKQKFDAATDVAKPLQTKDRMHEAKPLELVQQAETEIPVQHPEKSEMKPSPSKDEILADENTKKDFCNPTGQQEEVTPIGFKSFKFGASPPQISENVSNVQATNNSHVVGKRKINLNEILNTCDDEESDQKKKRKLSPSDDTAEKRSLSSRLHEIFGAIGDEESGRTPTKENTFAREKEYDAEIIKQHPSEAAGSTARDATSPTAPKTTWKTNAHKRKITVADVFMADDEDNEDSYKKKRRKIVPLEDTAEERKNATSQMTAEERRKNIKDLIDKIPTTKEEVFTYSLDWTQVDSALMEKRIKSWIKKKTVEFIGEEEHTLIEFICSKIRAGSGPQSILDDMSKILDDEAEMFVIKMWRMLIYETEAKKLGLEIPSKSKKGN